jgi:uncharacterized membrane protein YeaQ/YmgE (transglycosylase-associated protein family)
MFGLIWWIIVGLIAGWLTGKLMSGGGYGPLMDIVIGILGALAGGFIMSHLGFAGSGGLIYTIIVAVIGAVILTLADVFDRFELRRGMTSRPSGSSNRGLYWLTSRVKLRKRSPSQSDHSRNFSNIHAARPAGD